MVCNSTTLHVGQSVVTAIYFQPHSNFRCAVLDYFLVRLVPKDLFLEMSLNQEFIPHFPYIVSTHFEPVKHPSASLRSDVLVLLQPPRGMAMRQTHWQILGASRVSKSHHI